ncbi:MAG: hypothetical protein V5B35_15110 [Candidatus Accumulibacter necessarius]|jgi:hypothetical protein|uniref:hypothetical protein n=1 Tax=Candidatus Accumulibacter necessarius TaxID=2954386 RepID=UPI002FC3BB14
MLRHTHRICRLIALGLAFASATAVAAGSDPSGIRLTGVVMVPGESEWAVIEFPNGEQQIVRAGDKLPDIGSVAKILPTGIRLETPKGPRVVNLEWGAGGGTPPVAAATIPAQPEGHRLPRAIEATPEVLKTIGRVAATPGASEAELSQALIPLLDLPGDARVSGFFPGQPERDAKGPTEVSASLARGEVVRLQVEADGKKQMVYIRPGQPTGGASAGATAQKK